MAQYRSLMIIAFLVVLTVFGGTLQIVVRERKAEARLEIEAARGELEFALSSVVLRLANVASSLRQANSLDPVFFSDIMAEVRQSVMHSHERAIAFLPRIHPEDLDALDAFMTDKTYSYELAGYPEFAPFPHIESNPVMPVIFAEPADARPNVFGYNLASDPRRLEAAEAALDTGRTQITAPVSLSQDQDPTRVSFLVLHPVFLTRSGRALNTDSAVLAASITPILLLQEHVPLFSGIVVDLELNLADAAPLTVEIGSDTAPAAGLWRTVRMGQTELEPILLPGIEIPIRADAVINIDWRDISLPFAAATIAAILMYALSGLARRRERERAMLARALREREAELREAAMKASEAQQNEALGRLVRGVAHDFNNILSVIMGNLELQDETEAPAHTMKLRDQAIAATYRGAHLTKQLLSYGRKSQLVPVAVELKTVVDEAVLMLQRLLPSSITVTTHSAPNLPLALVDRSGLENAILNLALNARDAIDAAGKIDIEAGQRTVTREDINAGHLQQLAPGDYVTVSVKDSGHGIPDHIAPRVFDPFFSTKGSNGAGLGLSSVMGFCIQSSGSCQITETSDRGTTITMFFPVAQADAPPATAPLVEDVPAAQGGTILLAEDEPAVARTVQRQLENAGYTVHLEETGDSALAYIRNGGAFDLLLSDIEMPGEIQGTDLADHVRSIKPSRPVILFSGYPQEAEKAARDSMHRHKVLTKPVPRSILLSEIEKMFKRQDVARH